MSSFSIRARLIFLAILLLAILASVSLLLTRELARDSQALAEEAQLVSIVRNANNASKHFGDLKYWLADLAVTLLASSQKSAEAAKKQLDADLKTIAPVDAAPPRALATNGPDQMRSARNGAISGCAGARDSRASARTRGKSSARPALTAVA